MLPPYPFWISSRMRFSVLATDILALYWTVPYLRTWVRAIIRLPSPSMKPARYSEDGLPVFEAEDERGKFESLSTSLRFLPFALRSRRLW